MLQLFGKSHYSGSITVTCDQMNRIRKLYGFSPEPPTKKPDPPATPQPADFKSCAEFDRAFQKWEVAVKALDKWRDPRVLLQAGADRNTWRHAEVDGLRLLAWIAKYTEPDPLKALVHLACDAGWDVDLSDVSWANEEEEEEEEDADVSEEATTREDHPTP